MIYLETDRMILRDYSEADFGAYYRLKTDERTMYYMQDIKCDSIEQAKEEFAGVLWDMTKKDRKFYFLHMELKDTHEQVGSIGYTVVDRTPVGKIVHLGYFTYPKFWGNGYTSEALKKVLEYAFTKDGVYRVTTGCLAENKGSERVMQKNGMIKEAEHKDYEWHDGKMKDRLEYRLLKSEWEKMKTQDIYEIWNQDGSGVLSAEPLILTACKAGKMGAIFPYPGGCIYKTVFTYLCGKPDEQFLAENPDLLYNTRLVCMSPEWEAYIWKRPVKFVLRRELMKPLSGGFGKKLRPLPEGYSIGAFTEEIFEKHPFDQGRGYSDYQEFADRAAGAVVLFDGRVVSASSSFLSFEDHLELDVFTDPEHRGKGLADHCVYEMIRQSHSKGWTVHWDAQNPMSSKMAIGHGFVPEAEYAVYWLEKQ